MRPKRHISILITDNFKTKQITLTMNARKVAASTQILQFLYIVAFCAC
jgi:hypothetical protein